ncbi:MAG TPA: Holliday junction branch migration protein RuvA [Candidatus Thiothrix moscowensis]|uniref:Holliday junction branch migration protein RuvA n=1 Tax=unclassified Thiothrix TaxID=2636184 RepID=UPI0025F12DD0|nr:MULTISPECIES: Holliday junction branch migration protein RuvA [unclassified Thiothrix]HRJ54020.1 Holliday junction branch migration protein RuvA [Candidatus Thiothrix moscowensis]HRJ94102.1 Holliday junction branch migration protein RuvA [Candidatus Thiothrix moscowensis]
MIGLLRGKLLIKQPPDLMLDVNGVGYELQASMTTFYDLPELHTEVTLYTHFVVREDAQLLYGFSSQTERELFRQLLKVNGVGPKMALAIVSGMNPLEFRQVIHAGDITRLSRIPGVGKKTAERLVVELRDRLPQTDDSSNANLPAMSQPLAVPASEEAINALLALGYKPAQASQMIAAYENQGLSVEDMIRRALRASLN